MLRCLAVFLVVLAACKSADKPPATREAGPAGSAGAAGGGSAGSAAPPPAKPATPLAQVEAWAPKDTVVKPVDLKVAGVELFAVTQAKPSDEDFEAGRLVGVAAGEIVEGRALIKAVAAADAKTIARIALWAYQEEGELLDHAETAEQKHAKAGAPSKKGTVVTLWVQLADAPPVLERGTVDLSTGALELAPLPVKPELLISSAIRTLAAENVRRYRRAIELLAQTCADPRARQTLFAVLSSHSRDRTRVAVTEQLHKCGKVAVDPLIFSMEHDKSGMVRAAAATALGRVGEPSARPALAKASRGEDANLAWAAKTALGRIK